MEQYLNNFKNCLQKEIPFCAAECPFHLDVRDFIEKMKRGGFRGAFKAYRDAAGFPMIASALCHEPCKGVCPRGEAGGAIELLMLEKACISFTADRSPTDYNLPRKPKKVAIIGAGISGLACALRLCMKKYEVEIFEASERIGGYLWELLEPEFFLTDIEEQFKHENYLLHLNTTVRSPEDLKDGGFHAVYAATGEGGKDFGLLSENLAIYNGAGWFAGGGLVGEAPVYALANGLNMGTVIDNFLKTGNLSNPENLQKTCMQLDPAKLEEKAEPVVPAEGKHYSQEEVKGEAARCLECQCDFCRTYCDLTEFYNKWPLRIRDEIIATTLPGSTEVKASPAKRLLSTCNQCGLCKETCPEEIDLGGLILEGRKSMHRQKKAPWVFHDFWLRDMDFANGGAAALTGIPGEFPAGGKTNQAGERNNSAGGKTNLAGERTKCEYAFFPGCQLGASDPNLVEEAYRYLQEKQPGTGLLLRCCGAPAEWSGDEEKFEEELAAIRSAWKELGSPTLILACPTCEKKFKTYMTEIPVTSLYETIDRWGIDRQPDAEQATEPFRSLEASESDRSQRVYSVFDACAARHEAGMKKAVRALAASAGYELEPLKKHEVNEQCCSFGGQPGVANPEYASFVVQKRTAESENPYITYCINCRDVFLDAGKEALHILDILFGHGAAVKKLPTVSRRRENRVTLKRNLLKEFWNVETEEREEEKKKFDRKVHIPEALVQKLSRERILEEDMIQVLDFCERTGRRVFHPERGTYSGYREVGQMTYWVEYRLPGEGRYELVNAYAHRIRIELEAVWNGKKVDRDPV